MTDPDDDEDRGPGAPLPPEDRLWRHPSEVAASPPSAAPAAGSPTRPRRVGLLAVAVVSGLAGATIAVTTLGAFGALSSGGDARGRAAAASTTTVVRPTAAAASSVAPAVVEVSVVVGAGARRGSGVVARADGLIVTSALLVAGADRVEVTWSSGRREEATVEGADELTGLAAVSVDGSDLPTAAVDTSMPRPGDPAITVAASTGSPALRPGVVSATGTHADPEGGRLLGLIATDRPVPGWADGGALVDAEGRLRGVSLSVPEDEEGWAVPVEVALRVADDLRRLGHVDRGWLGVAGASSTPAGSVPAGMEVEHVAPRSPAAAAGIEPGDVLIAVGDQRVRSFADVKAALTLTRPGQDVTVERSREGTLTTTTVDLAAGPG